MGSRIQNKAKGLLRVGPREWVLGRGSGQRALKSIHISSSALQRAVLRAWWGNAPRASPDWALVNV